MAGGGCVAYFRVSTARRRRADGLDMDRQREAVRRLLEVAGRSLVAEFAEEGDGRGKADCPELWAALDACRRRGAALVVAELGRLRASAPFLLALEESGVDFVCADAPDVNSTTARALAHAAREETGAYTKAALATAKARGVELGSPKNLANRALGTARGNAAKAKRADERAAALRPVVAELRATGARSLREVAEALDARGITAPRGGRWTATQLCRALARR